LQRRSCASSCDRLLLSPAPAHFAATLYCPAASQRGGWVVDSQAALGRHLLEQRPGLLFRFRAVSSPPGLCNFSSKSGHSPPFSVHRRFFCLLLGDRLFRFLVRRGHAQLVSFQLHLRISQLFLRHTESLLCVPQRFLGGFGRKFAAFRLRLHLGDMMLCCLQVVRGHRQIQFRLGQLERLSRLFPLLLASAL